MVNIKKPKVPVTEQDTKKSYYKYYLEDMVQAPQEKYDLVLKGPLDPDKALSIYDRNRLFEPGYLDGEIGYCVMPDGTGYVANMTKMPGVTTEMFDWWFAWHALDDLRYTIWDPEDHGKAVCQQKKRTLDPALSIREKYWDTTHFVLEDIGMGLDPLVLNFKNPADLGFDTSKIGTELCSTIVCARGWGYGLPPFATPDVIMCHFVREIDGGIELRSRFWLGYTCKDRKIIKSLPDWVRFPELGPKGLCLHNIKEFTHLASLLPRIYKEEKDNFTYYGLDEEGKGL